MKKGSSDVITKMNSACFNDSESEFIKPILFFSNDNRFIDKLLRIWRSLNVDPFELTVIELRFSRLSLNEFLE